VEAADSTATTTTGTREASGIVVEAVEAAVYRPNENLPGIAFIHSLDLSFTPLTLLIKLIFFSCFYFCCCEWKGTKC
jgi:hypothetical protein